MKITVEIDDDPYDWTGSRTMKNAHHFIEKNWRDLKDGDVIDVEYILGETSEKKVSERFGYSDVG